MIDVHADISKLVRLNGGKLVGKTRLQKTVYLLEAKGVGFGLDYDYYHYGPFCPEVAFGAEDAEVLGYLATEEGKGRHGVPYVIYSSTAECPQFQDDEKSDARRLILEVADRYPPVVLELATTIHYFCHREHAADWLDQLKRRKTLKATDENVSKALELLRQLGLAPPESVPVAHS